MNLHNYTLVLVADGRKMLFLRNHGNTSKLDLRVEARYHQDYPAIPDPTSADPGRGFACVGSRRSTMEETDFHQIEEDRFAAETADQLRKRALGGDFESLVVVAPPRSLGELRKHYHQEVANRIVDEIDEDLTGRPIDEIEAALTRMEA